MSKEQSISSSDEDVPIRPLKKGPLTSLYVAQSTALVPVNMQAAGIGKGAKKPKKKKKRKRRRRPKAPTYKYGPSKLEGLPQQIHTKLTQFLFPISIARLSSVSKRMQCYMKDSMIWKNLSIRIWHIKCPDTCKRNHNWRQAYRTRMIHFRKGKLYLCPHCTCTYAFKSRESLTRHQESHQVDPVTGQERLKKHKCPISGCKKNFDWKSLLRKHLTSAHKVDPEAHLGSKKKEKRERKKVKDADDEDGPESQSGGPENENSPLAPIPQLTPLLDSPLQNDEDERMDVENLSPSQIPLPPAGIHVQPSSSSQVSLPPPGMRIQNTSSSQLPLPPQVIQLDTASSSQVSVAPLRAVPSPAMGIPPSPPMGGTSSQMIGVPSPPSIIQISSSQVSTGSTSIQLVPSRNTTSLQLQVNPMTIGVASNPRGPLSDDNPISGRQHT